MPHLPALSLAIAISLIALPAHAGGTSSANERLVFGKTNIFCVQAPCPWRGIVRADDLQSGSATMLWSQDRLPQLDASAEDATRLATAWDALECLIVEGSMSERTLRVDRIVGVCP